MRRIVIDAADVLTVLKRERPRRATDDELSSAEPADQPLTDVLPEELAKLEDTAVSHRDISSPTSFPDADDLTESNGDRS
jgi:hypothetical protein